MEIIQILWIEIKSKSAKVLIEHQELVNILNAEQKPSTNPPSKIPFNHASLNKADKLRGNKKLLNDLVNPTGLV